MNEYHTEGFVKTITRSTTELVFTIVPTPPYLLIFDKEGDEKSVRRILLVKGEKVDVHKHEDRPSLVVVENVTFQAIGTDYSALLVAKANHMKIHLTMSIEDGDNAKNVAAQPLSVNKFMVL